MSSWAPTKYKSTNWSAYNDSLSRRGSLLIWFDPEMVWVPPPENPEHEPALSWWTAHAVIPLRKNAKPWKPTSAGAIACNEAVNASRHLGRTIWQRWSGYHRRSRVETKMHCVKLLGQSLMARDFDRQVAEIQIRVAVLNRYTALGIPVTEVAG